MKNSTVNTQESNVNNTFSLTRDRYLEIVSTFKLFVKNKNNHPKKDERYGTKYNFNIKLVHFVLYAIIRNQDPKKTSHDPEKSEKYEEAIKSLNSLMKGYDESKVNLFYKAKFKDSFGITEEEINGILVEYFKD